MRIGIVIERLDPRRGGVEQWTAQFVRQLCRLGHEVHVVARGVADEVRAWGVQPHDVAAGRSRLGFAEAADAALRPLELDVVHDTGCGWFSDVFQPHGGSRTASFEQNLLLEPAWLRPLKRHAVRWLPRYRQFARLVEKQYASAECVYLAISQMVARDLQRYHQVPESQLRLVYNGVDTERFAPAHRAALREPTRSALGLAEHDVMLLIVAHNFRLKGVPTLVRAVERLAAAGRHVRLVVAGGKPSRGQSARAGQGSAALVNYVGPVADPVPLYAAADVYVQPTYYDPCSLVVLEALASGLPVVTSRFNGAGELMTPGVEGSIVHDPADDVELTDHLLPLLDETQRRTMGSAARTLALRHTLERNCREVLAVYGEVAARRRRAA